MKAILLYCCLILVGNGVRAQSLVTDLPIYKQEYTRQVGDIAFDPKYDDPAFNVPDTTVLFTRPRIEGEKPAIVNYFKEKYKSSAIENGNIVIHFFINREGSAGKFRIQTMDTEFQPKELDNGISRQILGLLKELKGWQPISYEGKRYSYYTYLNFKIVDGQIKEISP